VLLNGSKSTAISNLQRHYRHVGNIGHSDVHIWQTFSPQPSSTLM
jgi:hypothetical protein